MKPIIKKVQQVFQEKYKAIPLVVQSPGRINLIGEHTDYNDGFVLPAAIDKHVYIGVQKRNDASINLYSIEFEEQHETSLANLSSQKKGWHVYILGVVDQLLKRGYIIGGFNAVLDGDIPIGAGMSSSAAVECATIFALNQLFKLNIPALEMVKMAQLAEHEFAGVKCGIMDQFASMFGKKNHAIKLDCRSLQYQYVPFAMEGISIVLLDTNVKHSLASSAYNVRRQQCETGVLWIQQYEPAVKSLRDATMDMVNKYVLSRDAVVYNRCRFVVQEIDRLQQACKDLEANDMIAFGKKMFTTHEGLSKLYEVSCTELDFLVNSVKDNATVLGARMMGGGFGGCTINLVKDHAVDQLIEQVGGAYKKQLNKELSAYIAKIETGTSVVITS